MKRPAIIAVSGFSSEVGKTTLMCDLLRAVTGMGGNQSHARTLPIMRQGSPGLLCQRSVGC